MSEHTAARLLDALREETACPALEYNGAPELVPSGHETDVYRLSLQGGPASLGGPLIARCFEPSKDARAASLEAAIHEGLRHQGFPVPRVFVARDVSPAFLLMEALPGRGAADGLEVGGGAIARFAGLGAALRISLRIPEWLGETTRKLLAIDPEPILNALKDRGFPPEALGFQRHVDELVERGDDSALAGFQPGLRWLIESRPPEPVQRAVCHGDLAPNLLVEGGRVTGVIDWSHAFVTVGDPAFEVANSRVMLRVPLPLPSPLRQLARAYQRWLVHRYEDALGPSFQLSEESIRYYEAWRSFRCLLGAAETWKACATGEPFPERPDPWCVPDIAYQVARDFFALTGVEVVLPDPPKL